jgi:hypothetical protein
MRRFIVQLWNKLPPGASIAMMGLLAALYPILAVEPIPPREKALWIVGFFTLMCIEMFVIVRERARQDQSLLVQIARLDAIRSAYDAHAVSLERVRRSVKNGSLRDRAAHLSESILEFVHDRLENEPKPLSPLAGRWLRGSARPLGNTVNISGDTTNIFVYHQETVAVYKERFSCTVLGVIEEIEALNIFDEDLRASADSIGDVTDIQFVGRRLGEMAEIIKD